MIAFSLLATEKQIVDEISFYRNRKLFVNFGIVIHSNRKIHENINNVNKHTPSVRPNLQPVWIVVFIAVCSFDYGQNS